VTKSQLKHASGEGQLKVQTAVKIVHKCYSWLLNGSIPECHRRGTGAL